MNDFTEEILYERKVYCFNNDDQPIVVAFEPDKGDSYLMIIFSDNGTPLENPHHESFGDTLNEILARFDNNRNLYYTISAE